jgi:hypothetical protein
MAIPLGSAFGLAWLTKKFLEDPVRFGRVGWQCSRGRLYGPWYRGWYLQVFWARQPSRRMGCRHGFRLSYERLPSGPKAIQTSTGELAIVIFI